MEDWSRPSGISIPLFLKRKWEKQQEEKRRKDSAVAFVDSEHQDSDGKEVDVTNNNDIGNNEQIKRVIWEPTLRLRPDEELTRDERNEVSNRVFTTSELEERIWKTTIDMFDIQRQLYRGEEIYYEDTYSHGSIYKGWDAFVDMKDIGTASTSGSGGTQTSSTRRVPTDSRWFSNSCRSVSRTKPPVPFPPPLISQPMLSTTKLLSIPEQKQGNGTLIIAAPQTLLNPTSTNAATVATESSTETGQSSTNRIRQRSAAFAATASNSATPSSENTDVSRAFSTSKTNSRPATLIGGGINVDPGSTKKKRKAPTTTGSDEDPPAKKGIQKSSIEESKRAKTAGTPKTVATTAGTTKGPKLDHDIPITKVGTKSFKSEKKEGALTYSSKSSKPESSTPAKREKEVETPVPRKRGRPRRKT